MPSSPPSPTAPASGPALPPLSPLALQHGVEVSKALSHMIRERGGWLSFADFMRFVLYAPGLGYYTAGSAKLGAAGDFVTAPELSPLFGQSIARAIAPVLIATRLEVLELGAGSGALAASVLNALGRMGHGVEYRILEVSADLRARQAARLARFGERVQWLDALPAKIEGVVLANEVLDALPCEVVRFENGAYWQLGVAADATDTEGLRWQAQPLPANTPLYTAAQARLPAIEGFQSEINLEAEGLVASLSAALTNGAALFIDYGFPQSEFYHPDRASGTLMAHSQHRAHADPLIRVGLQDMTAHVDFTAMAQAAIDAGSELFGYTSQAQFLLNAGVTEALAAVGAVGSAEYLKASNALNRLLSPAEMGELFKVLAFGRGVGAALGGFARADRSHRL